MSFGEFVLIESMMSNTITWVDYLFEWIDPSSVTKQWQRHAFNNSMPSAINVITHEKKEHELPRRTFTFIERSFCRHKREFHSFWCGDREKEERRDTMMMIIWSRAVAPSSTWNLSYIFFLFFCCRVSCTHRRCCHHDSMYLKINFFQWINLLQV